MTIIMQGVPVKVGEIKGYGVINNNAIIMALRVKKNSNINKVVPKQKEAATTAFYLHTKIVLKVSTTSK